MRENLNLVVLLLSLISILISVIGCLAWMILRRANEIIENQKKMSETWLSHADAYWEQKIFATAKSVLEAHPLTPPSRWDVYLDTDHHFVIVSIVTGIMTDSILTIYAVAEAKVFRINYKGRNQVVSIYSTEIRQILMQIIGEIAANPAP